MENKIEEIASKHLGQLGSYAITTEVCDSNLLVAIPRNMARKEWGLENVSFKGYDTWHCYESTFLLDNGYPVSGTLKIVYPADSTSIVESKSLKLYLNSYDQMKLGPKIDMAITHYCNRVKADLDILLQCHTEVVFFRGGSEDRVISNEDFYSFKNISTMLGDEIVESLEPISDYKVTENHLTFLPWNDTGVHTIKLYTDILRSRCRITSQKDSGYAFFEIQTLDGSIDIISLLKQVISLREQNEFHEPCCEKLFADIVRLPGVLNCTVTLLYARRGGIDINPTRTTNLEYLPHNLVDSRILTQKTQMQ